MKPTETDARSGPPRSHLTAKQLLRIIAPRRRPWRWILAFVLVWGGFGFCLLMGLVGGVGEEWVLFPVLVGLLMMPVASVFLPAALGPVHLWDDVRTGRVESLLLTGAAPLPALRAYRRRTFHTAALLLLLFAPTWAIGGRAPLPLLFVDNVIDCHLQEPGLLTAPRFASGMLADLATIWLAAALGLAALVLLRSRAWAVILGALGTLAFGALGWLGGAGLAREFGAWGIRWSQSDWLFGHPVEPGYALLLWSFALPFAAGSVLLAELVLLLAARRLDRLMVDQ